MAPMSLRVLAAPSSDTSETPTLVLQCDARKYMFNAGEGTTRVSAQYRASNTRVDHIFLTRVASETCGGIPGLLMTLADGGRTSLDMYGPPNLLYALATTRMYARRDTMDLRAHEVSVAKPHVCYADEYIEVQSVPLVPSQQRNTYAEGEEAGKRAPSVDLQSQPWRNPSWRPSSLRGADAQAWFECIVKDAWRSQSGGFSMGAARCASKLPPPLVPSADSGEATGRQGAILSYICAGHTQRGKFDAKRASELGIPPGPAFARLSRGEDILITRPKAWSRMSAEDRSAWLRLQKSKRGALEHDNAEVEQVEIASADVVGASRAGPVFFYMHVPTAEHVEALVDNPSVQAAFQPYTYAANAHFATEQRSTPHMILHAVPSHVWKDPRYVAWREAFGPCHHIVANRDVCVDDLTYTSNAMSLLRLAELDQEAFRVPGYRLEPREALASGMAAYTNMLIPLQPRGEPSRIQSGAPVFDRPVREMDAASEDSVTWKTYCDMARKFRLQEAVPPRSKAAGLADAVEFTTLGTGSSAPSKYRNVLSTLVNMPGDGYVILDAGESTYFQLLRRFGPGKHGWDGTGIDCVLSRLKLLFVSHIHGDHHMGVIRILLERRKLAPLEPLTLVANNYTHFYLSEYDRLESLGLRDGSVRVIDNEALLWRPESGSRSPVPFEKDAASHMAHLISSANLVSVQTVPVKHRAKRCYGVVITHRDGWKLVFSGDTMPCETLVEAGYGATVLIHEATMQDDEAELAAQKGHSTIGQACRIARDMRAGHLLLTHFSQRYPKLARMDTGGHVPVGIAFDMVCMTPAKLRALVGAHPAMALLLEEEAKTEGDDEPPSEAPKEAPPSPRKKARSMYASQTRFECMYVLLSFHAKMPSHPPSELSISEGLQQALQAAHGLVGGAISVDVLHTGKGAGAGEAVVRVDAAHVNALCAAISGIDPPALATLCGHQPGMRVSVSNVSHSLALLRPNDRAWLEKHAMNATPP